MRIIKTALIGMLVLACTSAYAQTGDQVTAVANGLAVGQWGIVPLNSTIHVLTDGAGSSDNMAYAHRGAWDPNREVLHFMGASHPDDYLHYWTFTESTNNFATVCQSANSRTNDTPYWTDLTASAGAGNVLHSVDGFHFPNAVVGMYVYVSSGTNFNNTISSPILILSEASDGSSITLASSATNGSAASGGTAYIQNPGCPANNSATTPQPTISHQYGHVVVDPLSGSVFYHEYAIGSGPVVVDYLPNGVFNPPTSQWTQTPFTTNSAVTASADNCGWWEGPIFKGTQVTTGVNATDIESDFAGSFFCYFGTFGQMGFFSPLRKSTSLTATQGWFLSDTDSALTTGSVGGIYQSEGDYNPFCNCEVHGGGNNNTTFSNFGSPDMTSTAGSKVIVSASSSLPSAALGLGSQYIFINEGTLCGASGSHFIAGYYLVDHWISATSLALTTDPTDGTNATGGCYQYSEANYYKLWRYDSDGVVTQLTDSPIPIGDSHAGNIVADPMSNKFIVMAVGCMPYCIGSTNNTSGFKVYSLDPFAFNGTSGRYGVYTLVTTPPLGTVGAQNSGAFCWGDCGGSMISWAMKDHGVIAYLFDWSGTAALLLYKATGLQTLATQCAQTGVLRCEDFELDSHMQPRYSGITFSGAVGGSVTGSWDGTFRPYGLVEDDGSAFPGTYTQATKDCTVFATGTCSIKFTIPADGQPTATPMWYANLSDNLATTCGASSKCYMMWRQRFGTGWGNYPSGEGMKHFGISQGDPDSMTWSLICQTVDIAVLNVNNRGFPATEQSCGGSSSHVGYWPFEPNYTTQYGPDLLLESARSTPYCSYEQVNHHPGDPSNCDDYTFNQWITYYAEIDLGPLGSGAWATQTPAGVSSGSGTQTNLAYDTCSGPCSGSGTTFDVTEVSSTHTSPAKIHTLGTNNTQQDVLTIKGGHLGGSDGINDLVLSSTAAQGIVGQAPNDEYVNSTWRLWAAADGSPYLQPVANYGPYNWSNLGQTIGKIYLLTQDTDRCVYAWGDLATSGAGSLRITTVAGPAFNAGLVGATMSVGAGTNFVVGNYLVTAYNSGDGSLSLASSPTPSGGGSGGVAINFGGCLDSNPASAMWADGLVLSSNPIGLPTASGQAPTIGGLPSRIRFRPH
jgi:hypothetical protein